MRLSLAKQFSAFLPLPKAEKILNLCGFLAHKWAKKPHKKNACADPYTLSGYCVRVLREGTKAYLMQFLTRKRVKNC
jgi:hypothetical protein